MMIEANGIELHVEQRGAGGPALVFLHYWGGSARTWQHVVDALSPDYRTIAIDQRGWGKSASPQAGYALSDLVLYKANVFITPGGIFGESGNKYVRVSLCAIEENIRESINRIRKAGIAKSKQHV